MLGKCVERIYQAVGSCDIARDADRYICPWCVVTAEAAGDIEREAKRVRLGRVDAAGGFGIADRSAVGKMKAVAGVTVFLLGVVLVAAKDEPVLSDLNSRHASPDLTLKWKIPARSMSAETDWFARIEYKSPQAGVFKALLLDPSGSIVYRSKTWFPPSEDLRVRTIHIPVEAPLELGVQYRVIVNMVISGVKEANLFRRFLTVPEGIEMLPIDSVPANVWNFWMRFRYKAPAAGGPRYIVVAVKNRFDDDYVGSHRRELEPSEDWVEDRILVRLRNLRRNLPVILRADIRPLDAKSHDRLDRDEIKLRTM